MGTERTILRAGTDVIWPRFSSNSCITRSVEGKKGYNTVKLGRHTNTRSPLFQQVFLPQRHDFHTNATAPYEVTRNREKNNILFHTDRHQDDNTMSCTVVSPASCLEVPLPIGHHTHTNSHLPIAEHAIALNDLQALQKVERDNGKRAYNLHILRHFLDKPQVLLQFSPNLTYKGMYSRINKTMVDARHSGRLPIWKTSSLRLTSPSFSKKRLQNNGIYQRLAFTY